MTQRLITALFLLLLALAGKSFVEKERLTAQKRKRPLQPIQASYYGKSLKRYSLGFGSVIGDLLWVQTLQEASHEKLERDEVSWEFAQLDAITTLDPNFELAYPFGASFLSIFRQDKLGAKILLEKWVARKPTSWKGHHALGFHLFSEMGDYDRASKHILLASKLPNAPGWLSALGVRLLSEAGAHAYALKTATELYSTLRAEDGRQRLLVRIRSLSYRLQKSAWEEALTRFRSEKAGREPSSIYDLTPFRRAPERLIATLLETTQTDDALVPTLRETFSFIYDKANRSIRSTSAEAETLEKSGIFHFSAPPKGETAK